MQLVPIRQFEYVELPLMIWGAAKPPTEVLKDKTSHLTVPTVVNRFIGLPANVAS